MLPQRDVLIVDTLRGVYEVLFFTVGSGRCSYACLVCPLKLLSCGVTDRCPVPMKLAGAYARDLVATNFGVE